MSKVEENGTTVSSSASNDSSTESKAGKTHRHDDSFDFFIVTRFPEENYRFKWLLNQFSKLPIESELKSPVLHYLTSSWCRLKLVRNETEFILFHVTEVQSTIKHEFGEMEKAKVNRQFVFDSSNASQPNQFDSSQVSQPNIVGSCFHKKIPGEQKEVTNEEICTPKFQYEVSAEDRNGKQLIKWSVSFLKINQFQSQVIGKYASASLTNLPNDMLILDCHLKVILATTSEKQIFKTKSALGYNRWEQLSLDLKAPYQNPVDSDVTLGCKRWEQLSMDFKALYQNPMDADVTLNVGAAKICAHKSILAARSTVFKKIFQHDTKENEQNYVVINDVPLTVLQKLIEFLYTGVIQGFDKDYSHQELYNLYCAADKYEVMDLRDMCGNTMLSRATVSDASQILMWANRHNDERLKSEIMNFIRINFKAVTGTESWESCLVNETRLAAEVVRLCAKKL